MQISKDDFLRWRESPVTQAFLENVLQAVDGELKFLASDAGLNPIQDRFRVGHIKGLTELADWEPEFVEDTDDIES